MEPLFSISILPLTMRLTMVSQLLPFGTRTDGRRFKDTQVVPDFSDFTGRGYDFSLLTYKDYVKISIKKGWVYKLHQRKPVFPEKTVFLF